MTLLRWLTFLLGSQTVILIVLLFWFYFFLLTLVFLLQWLSLHWEILTMLLSQLPLTFHQIHKLNVWHAVLLHKLRSYGISGQIFGFISPFLSNRRLRVVLDGKSSQEYPVDAGVPSGLHSWSYPFPAIH